MLRRNNRLNRRKKVRNRRKNNWNGREKIKTGGKAAGIAGENAKTNGRMKSEQFFFKKRRNFSVIVESKKLVL
nr:hypothetical protein [Evansella caseinilytica]